MSDESKNIHRELPRISQPSKGNGPPSSLETELENLSNNWPPRRTKPRPITIVSCGKPPSWKILKSAQAASVTDGIRFANEVLIKDLLPIVDNLERAVAHASGGGNGKPLVEGVEMVLKGFLDVLSKHGVSQIVALGQSFDPSKHEAMAQLDSENHEPNSVIGEHQRGYFYRERLLRPALVTIAKGLKTNEKKNEPTRLKTTLAMIK